MRQENIRSQQSRDPAFNVRTFCLAFEEDVKTISSVDGEINKTWVLDTLYPLIDPNAVLAIRNLSKRDASSFINAVLAICHRSNLDITKLEAQTLFALDPVSKAIPDDALPNRSLQKSVFSNITRPITIEDLGRLDIGFTPLTMCFLVDGELIDGACRPRTGEKYSVFQLLRDPFNPESIRLRGDMAVYEYQRIVKQDERGVYFEINRNEPLTFKEKALIFILES